MSTYYAIQSKLSGDVIDIEGASATSGALLDAYPLKKSGNDNQLWEFVLDSGTGCYFIKSKLNGNVVDIKALSSEAGAPLDVFPQKESDFANQVWQFIPDPAGSGYSFVRSLMNSSSGSDSVDGLAIAKVVTKEVDTVVGSTNATETPVSDRKRTRLNSSHTVLSRMPSSA